MESDWPIDFLPEIPDLLTRVPLYAKYDISGLPVEIIKKIENFSGPIDIYCLECKQLSVFESERRRQSPGTPPRITSGVKMDEGHSHHFDRTFAVTLKCTRVLSHTFLVYFLVRNKTLIKVGQYPSLADLQLKGLDKYGKILGQKERQEFAKAIGLHAHGVGVGSFVYLRRIFENLIETAHKKAQGQSDWNEAVYQRERVHERILALRDYLPETLITNANIYSILSKGLHELSEDECLKYFETLKQGIELILDEELERRAKTERLKNLTDAIAKIKGQLQE